MNEEDPTSPIYSIIGGQENLERYRSSGDFDFFIDLKLLKDYDEIVCISDGKFYFELCFGEDSADGCIRFAQESNPFSITSRSQVVKGFQIFNVSALQILFHISLSN